MKAETVRVLKVFIASPSDVKAERRAAVQAIGWVNDHLAKRAGYRLESLTWERDVLPDTGPDAQSVINRQIGDMGRVAVFLLIMRDKFGSPTPRYGSGTEEEYERAVAARKGKRSPKSPHLLLCFGRPSAKADATQQRKVEVFKARVGGLTMYKPFTTTTDFERQVREFLAAWFTQRIAGAKGSAGAVAPEKTLTSANAMLLGDRVYRTGRHKETHGRMTAKVEVRTATEARALRALNEGYRKVPYAFGLTGGMVGVSKVEFSEEKGREVALVTFDAPQSGGEGGFGHASERSENISALRHILLGEPLSQKVGSYGVTMRDEALKPVVKETLAKSQGGGDLLRARLRAVQVIFATGLVSEIEKLTISAPSAQGVKVMFLGRARVGWSGETKSVPITGFVAAKKSQASAKHSTAKPKAKMAISASAPGGSKVSKGKLQST